MTDRPTDRELGRLLADLPRESASPDFSGRVLATVARPGRRRSERGWLVAAATAAAAALVAGLWLLPRGAPQLGLAETRALQEEHRLLMEELTELKASLRQSRPAAPVLYLGGNETLDLVLDLAPVWSAESSSTRPAVYQGGEAPQPAAERRRGDPR